MLLGQDEQHPETIQVLGRRRGRPRQIQNLLWVTRMRITVKAKHAKDLRRVPFFVIVAHIARQASKIHLNHPDKTKALNLRAIVI